MMLPEGARWGHAWQGQVADCGALHKSIIGKRTNALKAGEAWKVSPEGTQAPNSTRASALLSTSLAQMVSASAAVDKDLVVAKA